MSLPCTNGTRQVAPRGMMPDITVIGAGPAGLMAALAAARAGCRVLLLEAMDRPGRKLALTGHGRGNVSHDLPLDRFLHHFGPAAAFLKPALHALPLPQLTQLFTSLGITLTVEADGRIFPSSCNARGLACILRDAVCGHGVTLQNYARVHELWHTDTGWGIRTLGGDCLRSRNVILATGGMSYPATGSRGDGLRLAQVLGHRIIPPHPGLVGLHCPQAALAQGSTIHAEVAVHDQGRRQGCARGAILATHTGLSGPAVLDVSKYATKALAQGHTPWLEICFVPHLDPTAMDAQLRAAIAQSPRTTVRHLLENWLPPKFAWFLAQHCTVDPSLAAGQLPSSQRHTLAQALTGLRLPITGHGGWKQAMITCGGVDRRDVIARTLLSRHHPGLFFAGEILDMDGPSGGFNLHAALATGWHAGIHAARSIRA